VSVRGSVLNVSFKIVIYCVLYGIDVYNSLTFKEFYYLHD